MSLTYVSQVMHEDVHHHILNMALELTFVNQYGSNSAPKRRRLAKACESCRARKKRCIHLGASINDEEDKPKALTGDADTHAPIHRTNGQVTPANGTVIPLATAGDNNDVAVNGTSRRPQQDHSRPSTANFRHFISDLNPAATFLQRRPPLSQSPRRPENDDIGVWVDRREYDSLVRHQKNTRAAASEDAEQGNDQRPHSAVLAPLIDIYFKKVNPVLPLLDEAEFRQNHAGGVVPEALAHAVCLVAAKDADAAPHLKLNESTTALAPREFCSRLHTSITAAIRVPVRFEKITLIRVLALTSLHAEGPEGAEEATMLLNQAMHYTQTLGWHLGQHTGIASSDDLVTKRLFWSLWSLDRINSAIYGRPIMMSDIDIAIDPFEPGESKYPAFDVWLYLCRQLNKIIGYYRPGTPLTVTGWEDDYFSFEDALDQTGASDLEQPVLATLHLFYLLIALLSHRSRGVKYVPRATPSYVRQRLCAIELNRLMSSRLFSSLLPLPILPYAISLALSVSYQHLRQAQLQHQQEDAHADFKQCYQVLQKLRRSWSSADVIAAIAKKVLDQLDKASDLSAFRVSRSAEEGRSSPGICTASFWKPHTIIPEQSLVENSEGPANAETVSQQNPEADWLGLFEGMDDIFGTYLDPNYPVNLDDLSFVDDLSPLDWNQALT